MVSISLWSCSDIPPVFNSVQQYHGWVANDGASLLRHKDIDGYRISVRYLHPEFLAFKESSLKTTCEFDSLLKDYSNTRTFILTIGPAANSTGDVMRVGVKDYAEYKARFESLNFNMESQVNLKQGGLSQELLTYSFENTYGLTDHRSAYLVFSGNGNKGATPVTPGDLTLSFDGELFGVGMCHFQFKESDISRPIEFKLNDC